MEFYDKSNNLVLRPFGTGTSCIDTIYGECVNNVSLERCIQHCDESPYCKYGLYIEPKNSDQNYCLPLISVNGSSLYHNFVFNKNKSKLSDITTFFYDKRYFDFDDKLPKNILFLPSLITLSIKFNDGRVLFLTPNLNFDKVKPSIFLSIFAPNNRTFKSRVNNREKLGFHFANGFRNIDFDVKTKKALWEIYSPETLLQSYVLESTNPKEEFIDQGTPFLLKTNLINNKIFYWNLDKNNQLILTKEKPTNFTFEMESEKIKNAPENFTEKNTEMMENYLKKNFEKTVKLQKQESFNSYFLLFLVLLLIFFVLLKN